MANPNTENVVNEDGSLSNSSLDQRQRYIEIAAYYHAERRGFQEGGELQDWLEAERQITNQLPPNTQDDAKRQLSERESTSGQVEQSQILGNATSDNGVKLPDNDAPHWLQGG